MKTFKTHNTMPEELRMRSVNMLQPLLADLVDLSTQIKQAHWNVKGGSFMPVHKLMDDIHEEAEEWGDTVAERISQLGFQAMGTARMAVTASRLPELELGTFDDMEILAAIAERLGTVADCVRHCAGELGEDLTTQNMILTLSEEMDKQLWFVEAHLQR